MKNDVVSLDDLVENPTARVPICLCLDTSGSMDGAPIDELNEGIKMFYDAIKSDEIARYSAEICVVTFGGNYAECLSDFATLSDDSMPVTLYANGGTPMGEAVNMALEKLEARKNMYKQNGVEYYQPWLVLMTDGAPNGSNSEYSRAVRDTCELINNKKLTIFPIGIGEDADMDVLKEFSPKRTPLRLKGLNFREFFAWLSQSISYVSQSTPGESIKLPSPEGWGEV